MTRHLLQMVYSVLLVTALGGLVVQPAYAQNASDSSAPPGGGGDDTPAPPDTGSTGPTSTFGALMDCIEQGTQSATFWEQTACYAAGGLFGAILGAGIAASGGTAAPAAGLVVGIAVGYGMKLLCGCALHVHEYIGG